MTGSVTFTPTKAEYIAATRVHFMKQLASRRFIVRMAVLGLGLWLVVTLLGYALEGKLLEAAAIGLLSIMSGFAALSILIGANFLLMPRLSGRLYDQQKSLHRQTEFYWDDVGTRWISDTGDARYPWDDYHRYTVTKDVVLLYLNDHLMHFIPRHVLGTASEDLVSTARDAGVLPR